MKYLLSTGKSTTRIDEYILDLFKLNLAIMPNDIPNSRIGFDFIMTNVKEQDLQNVIRERLGDLVSKIKSHISGAVTISLDSVDLIDSETVKVVVSVNHNPGKEITIKLYENNTGLY